MARQSGVLREVDFAHTSGPEQPNNSVPGECLPPTQRHRRILGFFPALWLKTLLASLGPTVFGSRVMDKGL